MYRYRRTARFRSFAHGALIADFSFFGISAARALGRTRENVGNAKNMRNAACVRSSSVIPNIGPIRLPPRSIH
ncbi:hypothetical protein BOC43_15835 [Burkholderia pseudomallei]|nr:hypothetical protein BOC43_15835 [Burkholderia pseudomallei]